MQTSSNNTGIPKRYHSGLVPQKYNQVRRPATTSTKNTRWFLDKPNLMKKLARHKQNSVRHLKFQLNKNDQKLLQAFHNNNAIHYSLAQYLTTRRRYLTNLEANTRELPLNLTHTQTFASELGKLSNLITFKLDFKGNARRQLNQLSLAISNFRKLRSLNLTLSLPELNADSLGYFSAKLARLPKLEKIKLHFSRPNSFNADSGKNLMHSLSKLKPLNHLALHIPIILPDNNQYAGINSDFLSALMSGIGQLTQLKYLKLAILSGKQTADYNWSPAASAQLIISQLQAIATLTQLESLELVVNNWHINEDQVHDFNNCFDALTHIKQLNLSCQNISNKEVSLIGYNLRKLTNLKQLTLDFSHSLKVDNYALLPLWTDINYLENLETLSLNVNRCANSNINVLYKITNRLTNFKNIKSVHVITHCDSKVTATNINKLIDNLMQNTSRRDDNLEITGFYNSESDNSFVSEPSFNEEEKSDTGYRNASYQELLKLISSSSDDDNHEI